MRASKPDLANLPIVLGEVWQAHICLESRSQLYHSQSSAWKVLVVGTSRQASDSVIHYDVISEFPVIDVMWEQLVIAMVSPMSGVPSKPEVIEFRSASYKNYLSQRLRSVGIRSTFVRELKAWRSIMASVTVMTDVGPA